MKIYLPKKEIIRKMADKASNEKREQFYIIHEDKHLVVDLAELIFMCNKLKLNPNVIGAISYSDSFGLPLTFFSYQQQ